MRLSSSLLLASASSAFGQFTRFTNSSTSAVESATSSTIVETSSPLAITSSLDTTTTSIETTSIETATTSSESSISSVVLDLRNAILGPGASLYPPPDGDSILLSPVVFDSTLNRRQSPKPPPLTGPTIAIATVPFNPTASLLKAMNYRVYPVVNVTCNPTMCPGWSGKRAEQSPCVFEVLADGEVVLAQPITQKLGVLELSSNPLVPKDSYKFTFQQYCSGLVIDTILSKVVIKEDPDATSTPIPSIIIGTPTSSQTGHSTETNSVNFTTNSEGETVSITGTSSETATINSEGETIFPTETATGVTSEGTTTNSGGETVFPIGTATGTTTSASSIATLPAGFPGEVDEFTLFGCVASTAGFPTFTLAESNPLMDLSICGTLCAGRAYFGVYNTACYCGDKIDAADTSRVDLNQCDIECPGDKTEFCGGESRAKLRARQVISSNILLTVYTAAEAAVTLTESVTQTVTDQETIVTTFTTTVTGALSTATEIVTATLVCFAGKCHSSSSDAVSVYTFVEINGSDCDGEWVYVSEPCSCAGGQRYVPKFCSGGNCVGIQVYKPQACPDWYNFNSFFVPSDCSACPSGKIIYQPWENSWGTPDDCNDEVPTCNGHDCPSQQNVVRPHQGVNWNSTIPHGASGGGSNSGPNSGYSGNSQTGSGSGSNGESNDGSNASPNGSPNSGSSGGSGSGPQGESQSPNVPGSKGSYPSTVPIISGAGSQTSSVLSLLAALVALL
ncbi:hypothetical protein FBEOM_12273 [Fusarium beomiforme]|uniref:WSC domain-containing protein n=1 Tax=Fusarium beomiforme TaxID=44412 RepID=A0A9P5DQ20_9HYPO|nr:hypothetical protein FBEOM_12273 [Fusarium beomiforme]